jgi:CBS-domain-containing membrane protein
LTPKAESSFLLESYTLRQALEKMEYHHYTAMPVLDNDGYYLYTLFIDDCLWVFKNSPEMRFVDAEKIPIKSIKVTRKVEAVNISAQLDELIRKTIEQNFIPVVDDLGVYIGLVRRKDIIEYCRPMLIERLMAQRPERRADKAYEPTYEI